MRPTHEFVRSSDPNFGSAFGGGCDYQGGEFRSCGWPEGFHPGKHHCFTCNTAHDPDKACGEVETAGSDDFFDNVDPAVSNINFGPVFMARFESEDSCCGEGIVPGEDIRADGQGGWIHADSGCERMAR